MVSINTRIVYKCTQFQHTRNRLRFNKPNATIKYTRFKSKQRDNYLLCTNIEILEKNK